MDLFIEIDQDVWSWGAEESLPAENEIDIQDDDLEEDEIVSAESLELFDF